MSGAKIPRIAAQTAGALAAIAGITYVYRQVFPVNSTTVALSYLLAILFVATGRQLWGTFDQENDTVEIHPKLEAGSKDLLEVAAVQTFLNGGTLFMLPQERMPDPHGMSAVFRY